MTTNEISGNLGIKGFYNVAPAIRTGVEQLNLETWWTDFIQNQVDFGNKHYLRNFSLRLEMEVNDDTKTLRGY